MRKSFRIVFPDKGLFLLIPGEQSPLIGGDKSSDNKTEIVRIANSPGRIPNEAFQLNSYLLKTHLSTTCGDIRIIDI